MSCTMAKKNSTATLVQLCLCVTGLHILMRTMFPMNSMYSKPHGKIEQILAPKTFVSLKTEKKQKKPNLSEFDEVMGTNVQ